MVQPLGVKHVQAIHAVVLTGSATGAAERLHVTQPALSNRLRDAEERLGFELFERRAGRLVPTAQALLLFDEIERSFVGMAQINALCERIRAQRRRRISIACTPVFAATVLPRVLAAYGRVAEDVFFAVEACSADHVAARVASRKADVGFALDVPPVPGVHRELLADVPMLCYLHPRHPLALRGGTVHAAELLDEPMIGLSRGEGVAQIVETAFAATGRLPATVVECPAALAVCAMVSAGVGFAIFDALPTGLLAAATIAARPFAPTLALTYRAYRSETRAPGAEMLRLVTLAREQLQAQIAPWLRPA